MKKLRWAMDGSFWELDMSTAMTADGLARPVPGDPIPLGVSRGTRLSRAKQIHFMQRFMFLPFVPSYSAASDGFALHRALTIPFSQNWYSPLHSFIINPNNNATQTLNFTTKKKKMIII